MQIILLVTQILVIYIYSLTVCLRLGYIYNQTNNPKSNEPNKPEEEKKHYNAGQYCREWGAIGTTWAWFVCFWRLYVRICLWSKTLTPPVFVQLQCIAKSENYHLFEVCSASLASKKTYMTMQNPMLSSLLHRA